MRADLQNLVAQERRGVLVRLGAVTTLVVALPAARFSNEITVRDETPVVDPMQVGTEQVFDAEHITRTAIGTWQRFVASPGNQVAGVTDPQRVFGSRLSENAWYLDGIEVTEEVGGGQRAFGVASLGVEAYQELELKTGGFEAEYGRALGGVVSVITKSGGNTFSGSVDLRYQADAFQEGGEHFDADWQESSNLALDATLGGPLLRDRLWFFVACYHGEIRSTPEGSPTTWSPTATAPKAKLTWQASDSWRAVASYFGSIYRYENDNASRWTMPEATLVSGDSPHYLSLGLVGVAGDAVLLDLRAGFNRRTFESGPMSGDLETISHLNFTTDVLSYNYHTQAHDETERLQAAVALTWFTSGAGGSHELKAGLELSRTGRTTAECLTGSRGGERCSADVSGHRFRDTVVDDQPFPLEMIEQETVGPVDTSALLRVAYVQDSWRPAPNLTIKAGLRYDSIRYDMDRTGAAVTMDRWQPRLGVAWDLDGHARHVLRASGGRFADPATMTLPLYAVQRQTISYWRSCSYWAPRMDMDPTQCEAIAGAVGYLWRTDPEGWDPNGWFLDPVGGVVGSGNNVIDPGLESAYSDQLVLSYERALWPRSSVELGVVYKETRGLFEDTCNGNIPEPFEGADCDHYVVTNLPRLGRDYRALIVGFETRTLAWLNLLASYTLSESEGNHASLGMAADWDYYPWHWENRYGSFSDPRHVVKLNGYAVLPRGFLVAISAGWQSAFRWTPRLAADDIEEIHYGSSFVEPRGSREGSDASWLDLQLSKGFDLGPARLELIVSVLNLISEEPTTEVCTLVNGCGEIDLGEAISWEAPRAWELGLRLTF